MHVYTCVMEGSSSMNKQHVRIYIVCTCMKVMCFHSFVSGYSVIHSLACVLCVYVHAYVLLYSVLGT